MTGFVVAAAVAAPAAAQNTAGDDPAPKGSTRTSVSPVAGRGFKIEAVMRSVFDSNTIRLGDGETLQPGEHRADIRFSPSVNAAAGLPIGRQQLFIGADYGRDFYARNTRLNRDRYSIGGGAIWRLGRSCSGSASAEYKRRNSILSELSARTENVQEIQDYAAIADCTPPIGIGFGGSATRNATTNQSPGRRLFDSTQDSFDAHLNYSAPTLGQFSAGGSYSQINYPSRSVNVIDNAGAVTTSGDRVNIFSGRVSYGRTLGPRFNFNISGSYIKVKSDPRTVVDLITLPPPLSVIIPVPRNRPGFSGPSYSLSIGYNPGSRIDATLEAARSATASPNTGAQFVIRDSVLAIVNYKLRPSLSTSVGASFDRRNYKGSFATSIEPARSKESFTRFFGRVSFAPRPLYSFDFEVAHQIRNSTPVINNFSSTSAALTLRVKFGRG